MSLTSGLSKYPSQSSPSRAAAHGKGKAVLRASGTSASFAELSYAYPLKLLSPRSTVEHPVAIAYILSYGGGLVSGDRIDLDIDVGQGSSLLLLTQGSTKVFRARVRSDSKDTGSAIRATATRQSLRATIGPQALLLLLPDPITCFADATYSQTQTFDLAADGSAVVLDWFTSGRMSRGEVWDLLRYRSANEIRIVDRRVVKDVMLLEKDGSALPLKTRLSPYGCYATVFLFGPLVQPTIIALRRRYDAISQMQRSSPEPFIWSLSLLDKGAAGIVRAAGVETETVKLWLKGALGEMSEVVGKDVYDKAFV